MLTISQELLKRIGASVGDDFTVHEESRRLVIDFQPSRRIRYQRTSIESYHFERYDGDDSTLSGLPVGKELL